MKKLIFVSNFNNHYQATVAEEFVKIFGNNYSFVATTPFDQARILSGFRDMNDEPYMLRAYESDSAMREAQAAINEAECVILGAAPWRLVRERTRQGKLTFYYEEKLFKGDRWKELIKIPRDVICGICGRGVGKE